MEIFGNRLKLLRKQADYTQLQLAQRLGLTKSVISAYETGLRMPSYEVLISIARIFKVSTDYLLGVDDSHSLDLSGLSAREQKALEAFISVLKGDSLRTSATRPAKSTKGTEL